jgi:RND family efflux transporter MFP subunit
VSRFAWALTLAIVTGGCGAPDATDPEPLKPPAIRVREAVVTAEQIVVPVLGTGTIAAQKTTDIGPRVDGIIEEIFVKVGDRVQAGDPLFRTRQVDYQIALEEAGHTLRLAEAEAENAKRERKRIETLHKQEVASEDRLDDVRTADEIATARLGSARTALAHARQSLDDTVVRAPYSSAITRRYVDEGIMMITMMSADSPVVQIMKMDIVMAIVQIPEVHLSQVHLGTPARVRVDGMNREYESSVYIFNDRVDHVSRAFEVRLPIENPDLELKPGLFAKAELLPEARRVTVVTRSGVLGIEGNRYVYVASGAAAERRAVTARDLDATRMEVLEGLTPGERILVGPNLRRLTPGTPIIVEVDGRVDR